MEEVEAGGLLRRAMSQYVARPFHSHIEECGDLVRAWWKAGVRAERGR